LRLVRGWVNSSNPYIPGGGAAVVSTHNTAGEGPKGRDCPPVRGWVNSSNPYIPRGGHQ